VDLEGAVIPFWDALAFGCAATVFLVSGSGHLLHPRRFGRAVREQGLLPTVMIAPLAVLLAVSEVILGAACALALAGRLPDQWTPVLLAGTVCVCVALGAYVCALLVARPHTASCGCTPWSAALSPLSLVPAMVTGGLAALALVAHTDPESFEGGLLGALWGLTIAALVLATPAAVPMPRRV
jgi:FtsH-binding integral membrane protein